MKKGLIIAGLLIIIGGSAYLLFRKKKEDKFDELISNIGSNYKMVKSKSNDDVVRVVFNSKNNYVDFYNNGRFFIFDNSNKNVAKGSYANGGKKFVLDSGKTIESNSVWSNLINSLK